MTLRESLAKAAAAISLSEFEFMMLVEEATRDIDINDPVALGEAFYRIFPEERDDDPAATGREILSLMNTIKENHRE